MRGRPGKNSHFPPVIRIMSMWFPPEKFQIILQKRLTFMRIMRII
nr:MAG TPA: hypothetical protein [Caudoviricetes sp.]